jgi:hypothetical protein
MRFFWKGSWFELLFTHFFFVATRKHLFFVLFYPCFLQDFPSASWKKRSSDTPVRTIKTILHCMTKIKGNRILLHLSRIDNLNESELQSYLMKLIKVCNEIKAIRSVTCMYKANNGTLQLSG